MFPKYVLDNIAQEDYLCNVGPECPDKLSQENRPFLVACFLARYNTTEQSWSFLFNVGAGVHLRLVGLQITRINFDWNISLQIRRITIILYCEKKKCSLKLHLKKFEFLKAFSIYFFSAFSLKL